MRISAEKSALIDSLQAVGRIAATRVNNQILSGVQIAVTADSTELRATDMNLSLRVPLAAEVMQEGTVVLPARLLLDVAQKLPKAADTVTLEYRAESQDVEVISGAATFHIRTLRNEDFPKLPEPGGDTVVVMPTDAFLATIAMVARSASSDETRPVLTGVHVSAEADTVRMVATDSYRLSVKETKLQESLSGSFEANVPAQALKELGRLAVGTESVRIGVRSNQIVFEVGETALASRLIDGQFPNHSQLLPDSFDHELAIDADELRDIVQRIGLMAQKNAPLRLSFAEGQLTVSAQTPDVGEAREPLPVPFSGEPLEIGFNPDFLRDGLDAIGDGDIVLKLLTPLRPGLISGPEGSDFQYLIMPVRLDS